MGKPDWEQLISIPERMPKSNGRRQVVLRVLVPLIVAAVLWRAGRAGMARAVLVIAATLTIASAVSPVVRSTLERATAWLARWTGTVLTITTLVSIFLFVFGPVYLVGRALGWDPLATKFDSTRDSYWDRVERSMKIPLYTRQFAYERRVTSSRNVTPIRIVMRVYAVIVTLLATNFLLGWGIHTFASSGPVRGDAYLPRHEVRALDGPENDWYEPFRGIPTKTQYKAMVHFSASDVKSDYMTVIDGHRQTYNPPVEGRPLRVHFYGGSTIFGTGQRDVHTIPSEFARIAESNHIPVRVTNYGQIAYTTAQELQVLIQNCVLGNVPDIALFYDGWNDVMSRLLNSLGSDDPPLMLNDQFRLQAERSNDPLRVYPTQSALHMLLFKLSPPRRRLGKTGKDFENLAGSAMTWYLGDAEAARSLGASYGFQVVTFFQPWLGSKQRDPREDPLRNPRAAVTLDPLEKVQQFTRPRIKPPIIDLSGALDNADKPVMLDLVHTNELGSRLIAEKIFSAVEAQLRAALDSAPSGPNEHSRH